MHLFCDVATLGILEKAGTQLYNFWSNMAVNLQNIMLVIWKFMLHP